MALEVNQRVLRDLKVTANVRHHPYLIVKDDKEYLGNFWSCMATYPDHEMRHKKKVSLKALMMWLLSLYDEPNVNFQVLIASTNRFIKQIVKKKWIKKKKVWSKFLRVIYCLMDDIPALGEDGEMESSPGEVSGSFFNTLLESLCRHIVLFTTSYPMQMVEELISCWNRSDEPDAQMDFGWLPYIEVNMLLQQWSYLSNYKTETKPSLQPKSLAQAMGMEKIDTPTSSTYALGLPTIADASPSRECRSSDELDHQSLGSQYLTVEHFSNLIEYTMLYPRQLCLFEIGGSPVYISLASDKSDGGGARSQETWNALWPAGYQTVCADFPAGEHPMQVLMQAALEMIITEHRSTSNPNEDHKTPQLLSSTACRRTRLPCDLVFLKLTRFSAV